MQALQNELEVCDPQMLAVLNKAERSAKVVVKVLDSYNKYGASAIQTSQRYQTEMRWLRLGPVAAEAANPFPTFMREAMFCLS